MKSFIMMTLVILLSFTWLTGFDLEHPAIAVSLLILIVIAQLLPEKFIGPGDKK